MRVLLDECVDRRLAPLLIGYDVRTVQQMGWAGTRNGQLIELASEHFDVFVTMDRRLPDEQRAVAFALAIVLLRAKSNRIADLTPLVPDIVSAIEACRPGEIRVVGVQ